MLCYLLNTVGNKAWILASTCLLPSRWQTRNPALYYCDGCSQGAAKILVQLIELPWQMTLGQSKQCDLPTDLPPLKESAPGGKQAATANHCAFRQLSTEESRHTKREQMAKAPLLYGSKHIYIYTPTHMKGL